MRRLKTVRRPPIYPKTPGHLPCSSLTHPLPLSSRRPSVSFGGFGLNMKIRRSETKWALRQVLYRYVPPRLIERPKQGFSLPIGLWMRGPLRDWAESLLDGSRVRQEGFLDPSPIQEKLHQHLSGSHDWDALIWSVLMFQAWLEDTTRPTTPGSSESVRCSSQGETREQHRGRGPY